MPVGQEDAEAIPVFGYEVTYKQGSLSLATIENPAEFYRVEKMKFGGKRPSVDKTTVIYNGNVTMTQIPLEAYEYVVNGKPALEWVMERQRNQRGGNPPPTFRRIRRGLMCFVLCTFQSTVRPPPPSLFQVQQHPSLPDRALPSANARFR